MRVINELLDDAITGSTHDDRLVVHAWRGSELVAADLDATEWAFSWDADQAVQGSATMTVSDPDGSLAPLSLGSALGPGGSRLQVSFVQGDTKIVVPLGFWRITDSVPAQQWRIYDTTSGPVRVAGGGLVRLSLAEHVTYTAMKERLDAETVRGSSCLGEVRRLLQLIGGVDASLAPPDRATPGGYVYGEDRLDGVRDMLSPLDATYRVGAGGDLQVIPKSGVGPVWNVAGGREGVLVDLQWALSDEGLYNAAISTGQTADGAPLVGRAYRTTGPLAWGGPFGRVPVYHRSPATSQTGVNADAETLLTNRFRTAETILPVQCLTHPGIQVHDIVTIVAPTLQGDAGMRGRVVSMRMSAATSDAGTVPAKTMDLAVAVSTDELEAVAARVARG